MSTQQKTGERSSALLRCGIDMGGTKTEIIVLRGDSRPDDSNIDTQGIAFRERVPTPQSEGYEGIIQNLVSLINKAEAECGPLASIGIAHPGTIDPSSHTLINSNTVSLNGKPFQRDLERLLGRSCAFANDANCFALAESLWGAARDYRVVFGVILGTGVGGGIVLNDVIHGGLHGIGGEWGHNVLIPDGDLCYCGKRGCVETVISGPALKAYFHSLCDTPLSLTEIEAIAFDPEASSPEKVRHAAEATFQRLYQYGALAMSVVINILDPDCIVLGGGVSNTPGLADQFRQHLQSRIFHDRCDTVILKHQLGDSAGIYGAALCARAGTSIADPAHKVSL